MYVSYSLANKLITAPRAVCVGLIGFGAISLVAWRILRKEHSADVDTSMRIDRTLVATPLNVEQKCESISPDTNALQSDVTADSIQDGGLYESLEDHAEQLRDVLEDSSDEQQRCEEQNGDSVINTQDVFQVSRKGGRYYVTASGGKGRNTICKTGYRQGVTGSIKRRAFLQIPKQKMSPQDVKANDERLKKYNSPYVEKPASRVWDQGDCVTLVKPECIPGDQVLRDTFTYTAADYLYLLADVAAGVAHVHEKGDVHCDLKPDNFLRTTEGRGMVADFDMARSQGTPHTLFSNPKYYVKQKIVGQGKTYTTWDDVGALGFCLLYALQEYKPQIPSDVLQEGNTLVRQLNPWTNKTITAEQVSERIREFADRVKKAEQQSLDNQDIDSAVGSFDTVMTDDGYEELA